MLQLPLALLNMTHASDPSSTFQFSSKQGFLPYAAPMAGYLIFTSLESDLITKMGYPGAYAMKAAVVALLVAFFHSAIPKWNRQGMTLALIFGTLGCPIWIGLDWLQNEIAPVIQLNFMTSERTGFSPTLHPLTVETLGFLVVRMIGLVLLVPLIEEIFWRGFLARYLIDESFEGVAHGKYTLVSGLFTTVAFAAVHPEILSAIVWGAGVHWIWVRTGNLWACIVAHAMTNALLGGYVLSTGSWHLW